MSISLWSFIPKDAASVLRGAVLEFGIVVGCACKLLKISSKKLLITVLIIRFINLILQKERQFDPLWFVTFEEKINIYV